MCDSNILFSTLAEDELARVVRHVPSPYLVPLLASECSIFSRVVYLLVSKLVLKTSNGMTFRFVESTLSVGLYCDQTLLKSVLKNCTGLKFKEVSLPNASPVEDLSSLSGIFVEFLAPHITLQMTKKIPGVHEFGTEGLHFLVAQVDSSLRQTSYIQSKPEKLFIQFIPPLKAFMYAGDKVDHFNTFWEKVGNTLEEVRVVETCNTRGYSCLPMCIRKINTHCRNLSIACIISFGGMALKSCESQFVNFLTSYGNQITKAEIPEWLGEESLLRIARECPNMQMKIGAFDYRFSVLNNRTWTLYLQDPPEDSDGMTNEKWRSLSETMVKCTALENLCVNAEAERSIDFGEFLQALLPIRMDSLQYLNIKGYANSNDAYDPLERLANVTSNLKEFHIASSTVSAASIHAICSANRKLHTIYVDSSSSDGNAGMNDESGITPDLIVYIHAFLISTYMRKFTLVLESSKPTKEELRNLCVRFRSPSVQFKIQFSDGSFQKEDGEITFSS